MERLCTCWEYKVSEQVHTIRTNTNPHLNTCCTLTRIILTEQKITLMAHEPDDSAAPSTSTKRELLQVDKPENRFVDRPEQATEAQKSRTGTQFTECNIFRHDIPEQDQTLLTEKLRALHAHEDPFSLPPPDIERLAQTCLGWIINEHVPPHETDFVSQLTSHALARALEDGLDKVTASRFQDFVLATTLAYTAWRDHRDPAQRLSIRDLHRTSYLAGSSLLQNLDRHLDPATLEGCPRPTLQALFLVLFGTILGVAYSTQIGAGPPRLSADLSGKVLTESPTPYVNMKERLCHLLADRLALLAQLLWDSKAEAAETTRARVLDGCLMGRWARAGSGSGRWAWGNLMPHYAWPAPSDYSLDWLVQRPGGTFQPVPRAAMMWCPEVLSPLMPRMDTSDRGKRRSMLIVGPTTHGQHMYTRMRTHAGSEGPPLFV
ncbi:hypothetical protein KVR01_000337 [Diaporthe batatas]|uniref:uncharacterized protein n=1 Tax=Diaporthe batatas TaxID=748121 RepID=UPI001D04D061|nr:uncharacterized protein KVR01_000337 [Diaporthe batatas]KAG8169592.1 hypothetical protein KVR01_000337 [Diaporthe batatas]